MKYSKESDLAEIVVNHFKKLGWTVFKEVTAKGSKGGGSKRIDIFCEKDGFTIGIETKLNFNLTLMNQCWAWKTKANKVYACFPKKRMTSNLNFGYFLMNELGIGIIEIKNNEIIIKKESTICENPDIPILYNEQKTSVAGSKNDDYLTPFKMTRNNIYDYLKGKDWVSLEDLIKNIKHHYSNKNSAKNSISKMIKINVIQLEMKKIKNKLHVKYI